MAKYNINNNKTSFPMYKKKQTNFKILPEKAPPQQQNTQTKSRNKLSKKYVKAI